MRRTRALLGAVAVAGLVGGLAGPAQAAKPDHAGPPERSTENIVGSGEPTILCDGQEIRFTGGVLRTRFQDLPRGRAQGGFVLRNATASDGDTTYRVRGSGRFRGTEEAGSFTVHLVLIGPRGQVEKVRETTTFPEGTVDRKGSCTLQF